MKHSDTMIYKTKPYEHQKRAYDFAHDKESFAWFMEMGTGKTKTAIDTAANWYKEGIIDAVLVIAPNGVHTQWGKEQVPLHCSVDFTSVIFKSGGNKTLQNALHSIIYDVEPKLKFLMVNVEAFSYPTYLSLFQTFIKNWRTFVIIDEATAIKNPDAKRTMNIIRGLSVCKYRGKSVISCVPLSVKRAILTGTPITNSPFDLWAMFEFLKPSYFNRTYYSFKAHYGLEKKVDMWQGAVQRSVTMPLKPEEIMEIRLAAGDDYYAICAKYGLKESDVQYIKEHTDCTVPYKYLDELKELIAPSAFFVSKDECLDLEPKIYKRRIILMCEEQQRLYDELEKVYITEFKDQEVSVLNKVVLYTRLSQICGGFLPYEDEETGEKHATSIGKNPKAEALMEELQLCDYPCIVVTRFTAEALYLHEEISKKFSSLNIGLYIGPKKEPKDVLEQFKAGYIHILIANERMISKGHNLQNAHNVFFFSNSYSLEDREQTEDRIHRNGQTEKCVYMDLIMLGSMDMKVYAALKAKKKLLDYFRDTSIEATLNDVTDDMQKEFEGWL